MSARLDRRAVQIQQARAIAQHWDVTPPDECICEVTQMQHEDLSWSRSMVRVPDPHCEVHPAG